MRRFTRSLAFRLVLTHLAVAFVAVTTTVLISRYIAGSFFDAHLRDMAGNGSIPGGMVAELQRGFSSSFGQALTIAVLVSTVAVLAASAFAGIRVLRPLAAIRKGARRLARGSYSERVPIPTEIELAALGNDVNALAEALETTEKRRVQLITEVAHELRTPLATIQGYMEGLLDGVFQPSEEIFAATARESARLQRLALDLHALSEADEGSPGMELRPLDLDRIAAEAAERLRPQFEAQGVALHVRLLHDLPVRGDPDRLAQVFTNIVGNALTHTEPGGRVELETGRIGEEASVAVTDTGKGIPPEQLEAIFERFYRIDRSLRGGTGIGLTIARRIARLHGGDVTAHSEGIGRGSSFRVSLPLA